MKSKLGIDVFLALAAIGWADGQLDPEEADAIVRAALEEGIELEEIEKLEKAAKTPVDIGAIDISKMSKADRLFVYAVASWVARVDGHVDDKERAALSELGAVLKIPEKPRQHAEEIARDVGKTAGEEAVLFNLPMLRKTLKVRLAEAQKLRAADKA